MLLLKVLSAQNSVERLDELINLQAHVKCADDLCSMSDMINAQAIFLMAQTETSLPRYIILISSSEAVVYLCEGDNSRLIVDKYLTAYDARVIHGRNRKRYTEFFQSELTSHVEQKLKVE